MKRLVQLCLLGAFAASACQRHSSTEARRASRAATSASTAVVPVAFASTATLPEDPEAGARSVAEWKQHLVREERERRLNYDRRRLSEHRQIVSLLRRTRESYDRASAEPAVSSSEQRFRDGLPKLERMFEHLDHWGVSSQLLPDYKKLADDFSEAYPKARIAALAGEQPPFTAISREVDARFQAIEAWLNEAEESEDE